MPHEGKTLHSVVATVAAGRAHSRIDAFRPRQGDDGAVPASRHDLARDVPGAALARVVHGSRPEHDHPHPRAQRRAAPVPPPHPLLPGIAGAWRAGEPRDLSHNVRRCAEALVRLCRRVEV